MRNAKHFETAYSRRRRVKKMEAMNKYGLREPEFIDMEIGFRINLYREKTETNVPDVPENTPSDENENLEQEFQARLLEVIRFEPQLTQTAIFISESVELFEINFVQNNDRSFDRRSERDVASDSGKCMFLQRFWDDSLKNPLAYDNIK